MTAVSYSTILVLQLKIAGLQGNPEFFLKLHKVHNCILCKCTETVVTFRKLKVIFWFSHCRHMLKLAIECQK